MTEFADRPLPGAYFFDHRPAAVPAAWLFVVIEIAELLPGAVLHDTGGADVLDGATFGADSFPRDAG